MNSPTSTTRTIAILLALAIAGLAAAPVAAAATTEPANAGPLVKLPGICVPFTTVCTTPIGFCISFTTICVA